MNSRKGGVFMMTKIKKFILKFDGYYKYLGLLLVVLVLIYLWNLIYSAHEEMLRCTSEQIDGWLAVGVFVWYLTYLIEFLSSCYSDIKRRLRSRKEDK